jgi:hypothetical protein
MMTSFAELSRDLDLAMADHCRTFGLGPGPVDHARNIIKIMLWDHRRDIARALKIAAVQEDSSTS